MRSISLKLKVSIYLTTVLSLTLGVFVFLGARYQQEDLLGEIARHAMQTSDVIVKSTRYAMLINRRDSASMIIQDIGKQKGIERVRVMNKDGIIIHSNHAEEI